LERDAWAFLDAAGITSSRQQEAIIQLVRDLKQANLWTKMKAIYPFVGGTATTHKWNLKDPQDTDAAFRLVFNGGWTHSSTGALPNGTNGYGNTYLNENTTMTFNNQHMSVYSRTDSDGLRCDMGVLRALDRESSIFPKYQNIFYPRIHATNNGTANTANSLGLFISNRTGSTQIRAFQNTTLRTINNTAVSKSSGIIFISAHSFSNTGNNNTPQYYSNRELAFATIGDGVTDAEATLLYNCVDRYQKFLGRAV
jgi:hypothetical protein